MTTSLEKLLSESRDVQMSRADEEEQRASFAFGTAKIENEHITREMIRQAAASVTAMPKRQ